MNIRRGELLLIFLAALAVNWLGTMWWVSDGALSTAAARGPAQVASQEADVVQAAAIPRTFSYQGTLRDANGNPITGNVKLTLRIYDVVSGGSPLYTEVFDPVFARTGVFSIVVGDTNTIPANLFDNERLFLGIAVNDDAELTPRQRLHPVPWAMQASTALNALTANNLAQGGGVPNIVRFGTGGAKEIAFVGGGKITDAPAGMTFNSPAFSLAGDVTVGGDLTVNGDWSAGAILDKGDSNGGTNQRSTYPVSINRYVIEAPDNGAAPDTVTIDDTLVVPLCGDGDGCTVRLGMRDWAASRPGDMVTRGPINFVLGSANPDGTRPWTLGNGSTDGGAHGIDKNGTVEHVLVTHNACFFTDGEYVNATGTETAAGFGLLNWFSVHDSLNMVCVLIIED